MIIRSTLVGLSLRFDQKAIDKRSSRNVLFSASVGYPDLGLWVVPQWRGHSDVEVDGT